MVCSGLIPGKPYWRQVAYYHDIPHKVNFLNFNQIAFNSDYISMPNKSIEFSHNYSGHKISL